MHILVIRTSAMGDVALTVPVIASLIRQYPDARIVLLTRSAFAPFFQEVKGLYTVFADFRGRHRGLAGIFRLYRDIRHSLQVDLVIDLHDVIRSKILRGLFRLSGKQVTVIDKGRREKRALVRGRRTVRLKHATERYAETFARAGIPVLTGEDAFRGITWNAGAPEALKDMKALKSVKGVMHIGVAPFAKHKLKIWPMDYMAKLLALISGKRPVRYWFFGGAQELGRLRELHARLPESTILSDHLNLSEELAFMAELDLMIAMDSSNMHMAALAGTKVVSIWGATDPMAGFGAWNQPDEYAVRIPVSELTCRPCTVYGKGECHRGDFACMIWLTPEKVFQKLADLGLV